MRVQDVSFSYFAYRDAIFPPSMDDAASTHDPTRYP